MENDTNSVYYCAIRKEDGTPTVICLQWFDEYDYDHGKYITNKEFKTEEEAWRYIDKYKAKLLK